MVPVPPRPARWFAAAVVVLVLLFVAVQWVRSVEPFGLDQGLFACYTRWLPRGWLPYRDLFDSKPPLFLYVWALPALIPGDLVRSVWRFEAAWLAGTVLVAYAIGKRVWDRQTGLAAAALLMLGLWAPGWGGYWSRAQAEELLALPLLGAAFCAWRAVERPRLAFAAGVLTGIAGLFKIPSLAVAAAWPILWAFAGAPWRRVGLMLAGLLLPWAIAVGWFAAHRALGDFYRGVFEYQRHFAALNAQAWGQVITGFSRQMIAHASLLLALAGIGIGTLFKRDKRQAWWLLSWIVMTMGAVVAQRQLAEYHFILVMPGLAMAAGFGLVAVARAPRTLAMGVLVAVAALGVYTGSQWWKAYQIDALHLAGSLDRESYLRRLQPGGFSSSTEEQAARYLRAHTQAGDGVLVWGLSPGIYALADRHPVTRYPFHKLLMTYAPLSRLIPGLALRREELMTRLERELPPYVLLGRGDRNGFEPQDSVSSMMQFDGLRELLKEKYRPETEIGRFLVLRRN
jgi:4-amino-4-deoxy-L-arabinose transferase-like glycosyltransferase